MSLWTTILLCYLAGVLMCGISAWVVRKSLLTTRGQFMTAAIFTFVPVANYVFAVAFICEGDWGAEPMEGQ